MADAEARLLDTSSGLHAYVEPQVLWWGFNPKSAARRGLREEEASPTNFVELDDPAIGLNWRPSSEARAVVLIDEIDKADPEVPNDLLVV